MAYVECFTSKNLPSDSILLFLSQLAYRARLPEDDRSPTDLAATLKANLSQGAKTVVVEDDSIPVSIITISVKKIDVPDQSFLFNYLKPYTTDQSTINAIILSDLSNTGSVGNLLRLFAHVRTILRTEFVKDQPEPNDPQLVMASSANADVVEAMKETGFKITRFTDSQKGSSSTHRYWAIPLDQLV